MAKQDGWRPVETGLYKYIPHPHYLGNLFLLVACRLFLAARIPWVFTVLGVLALLAKIEVEERFLPEPVDEYNE